jgi:hypothetical protein
MIGTKKKSGKSVPNCVPKEQYDIRDTINLISELFGPVFASKFGSRLQSEDSSVTWDDINNSLVENNVSTETIAKVATFFSQLDEEVEQMDENYRVLAQKGIGAERKVDIKVGHGVDYYHPKDGSKHMGKIHHMDDKSYTVIDDKTGSKHKFDYYRKESFEPVEERNTLKNFKRILQGKDITSRVSQELTKAGDAAYKDPKKAKKHYRRYDKLVAVGEATKKKVVVKTNEPVGYRIADIGPGGKEYNVKTDKAWDKKMKKEQVHESRVLAKHGDVEVHRQDNGVISVRRNGKQLATGEFDRGSDLFFISHKSLGKGQRGFDTSSQIAKHFHGIKETKGVTNIDEISQTTRMSYLDAVRKKHLRHDDDEWGDRVTKPPIGKQRLDMFNKQSQKMIGSIVKQKALKKEEVEQMDEISNRAKHRYMGSAVADLTSRSLDHGAMSGKKKYSGSDLAKYQGRKIKNRQMGIARVADTLVKKEEVEQMDELNKGQGSILNRYIRRATDDFGPRKGRESGVRLALKKKFGNKKYGLDEPKVKAVTRESLDVIEKAPPGAKYERMVKHIKKSYAKDGLTDQEKSISYATAWKAKNRGK